MSRPIRPATNWKDHHTVVACPASSKVIYKPVDVSKHADFAANIRLISPERR